MPTINMKIELLTLDTQKVTLELIKFIKASSKNLMGAYLSAITNRIPVRTGFLRGSFRRLADKFNVPLSVVPRVTGEYYNPGRILKTPSSGIPFMISPDQALVFRKSSITFTISNSIAYYSVMDFTRRGRGTPWGSINAGHTALLNRLEVLLSSVSNINKILVGAMSTTTVAVGSGGVRVSQKRLRVAGDIL